MSASDQSLAGSKPSALPRFSMLPQPRSTRAPSDADEESSVSSESTTRPPLRTNRFSIAIPQSTNPIKHSAPESLRLKNSVHGARYSTQPQGHNSIHSIKNPEPARRHGTAASDDMEELSSPDETKSSVVRTPGKARPSLSDRTAQTLSQIPPSPSPNRRQSGFFTTESPMRPSSRAASALDYNRPGSQASRTYSNMRPPSPIKKLASAPNKVQSAQPTTGQGVQGQFAGGKRAVSSKMPRPGSIYSRTQLDAPTKLGNSRVSGLVQRPAPEVSGSRIRASTAGSKTIAAKPSTLRSPITGEFASELPKKPMHGGISPSRLQRPVQTNGSKSNPISTLNLPRRLTFQAPKSLPAVMSAGVEGAEEGNTELGRSVPDSSLSLKETIAKAKAAARSTLRPAFIPRSAVEPVMVSSEVDPSSFDTLDSSSVNILRKRINSARTEGRLNIADLCLTKIPKEVLQMFVFDESNVYSSPWYENVDLKRLNAADNEIKEIGCDVFPDEDPESADPPVNIFITLETLDLHGNQLSVLPQGLRRLPELTTLNLSRNFLGNEAVKVIGQINSLKELRFSNNQLKGTLPNSLFNLENLEILELHDNHLSELPGGISHLTKLRILNVSSNRLTALHFNELENLPLVEIIASGNKLEGVLISYAVSEMSTLRTLDVSANALTYITETEVRMPSLRTMTISNNRVVALPHMKSWGELSTLIAHENKISELPPGFTELSNLRKAVLSCNSLLTIDESIGSMDTLTTFNIQDNPLHERKMLKMNTEDLKIELRNRQSRQSGPLSPSENGIRPFMLLGGDTKQQLSVWTVSSGVLDRSTTKLAMIDESQLEGVQHQEVKTFIAHHNQIQQIPTSIRLLGATLTVLDISHNKLGKNEKYLAATLVLPYLQTLNLTSNGLLSLLPLVRHLDAPVLTTMILPFNRITSLPPLSVKFPTLSTLLASNNKIDVLDVKAVNGLRVLDLGSNEIEQLPAELALLPNLKTLMVSGNKFRVPGWGVLEKGTEAIKDWCRKKLPEGHDKEVPDYSSEYVRGL